MWRSLASACTLGVQSREFESHHSDQMGLYINGRWSALQAEGWEFESP